MPQGETRATEEHRGNTDGTRCAPAVRPALGPREARRNALDSLWSPVFFLWRSWSPELLLNS